MLSVEPMTGQNVTLPVMVISSRVDMQPKLVSSYFHRILGPTCPLMPWMMQCGCEAWMFCYNEGS